MAMINILFFQGILPRSAVEKVMNLTVPEENLAEAMLEAETLPSVEITKLDLQWLQVKPLYANFVSTRLV